MELNMWISTPKSSSCAKNLIPSSFCESIPPIFGPDPLFEEAEEHAVCGKFRILERHPWRRNVYNVLSQLQIH